MPKSKSQPAGTDEALERFELLGRATLDVVWDWDLLRGTLWWNHALGEHLGYQTHQMEPGPESWYDRIHPEDKVRVLQHLHQLMAQPDNRWSAQYRFRRADGLYSFIYERGSIVRQDGKAVRLLGSMQDFSHGEPTEVEWQRQLKQHTQALAETTARFNQAEAMAHIGSYEVSFDPLKITFSDEMYRSWGYEPGTFEMTPTFLATQIHPDDRPLIQAKFEQAHLDAQPYNCRFRIYWPDGQLRYLNLRNEIICDQTGKAIKVLGTSQDVTQQTQAQQQLQQTAEHLQAVLDSSPAVIGFLKPVYKDEKVVSFRLMVCNQRFAQLSRKPIDQLIGQPFNQFSHMLWQDQTFKHLLTVAQTGEPFYREQPESGGQWFSITVTKWDGGLVIAGLDITALKESQQHWSTELEHSLKNTQALQALQTVMQQRGELLRAASHDLRGNLGIISGAAKLLELVSSQEERSQMLAMVQRNVGQATQMLTDLLDYARLEAGQEQVKVEPFDVAGLLQGIIESVKPVAREKGLAVTLQGPPSLTVEEDALNVRRIAQNLILNAIKYTPVGQVNVTWGTDPDREKWWFTVQDTGPGLPSELVRGLLAEGEGLPLASAQRQPDAGISTPLFPVSQGGTLPILPSEGIGLRIVRQLVALLKAQLWVDSQPGRGTEFTVSLPLTYSTATG